MNDLIYYVYNENNERHYFMSYDKAKKFYDTHSEVRKLYGKTKNLFATSMLVMWK